MEAKLNAAMLELMAKRAGLSDEQRDSLLADLQMIGEAQKLAPTPIPWQPVPYTPLPNLPYQPQPWPDLIVTNDRTGTTSQRSEYSIVSNGGYVDSKGRWVADTVRFSPSPLHRAVGLAA